MLSGGIYKGQTNIQFIKIKSIYFPGKSAIQEYMSNLATQSDEHI